jgi:hypothetical protein
MGIGQTEQQKKKGNQRGKGFQKKLLFKKMHFLIFQIKKTGQERGFPL